MKKLISFILFAIALALSINLSAQTYFNDIVYLKNDSIVKGEIIEINPETNIKIITQDGGVFVFEMRDIKKITSVKGDKVEKPSISIKNTPKYIKTNSTQYRDPVVSTALSFVLPGIGQFYNGQNGKGASHLVWYLASYGVMYYSFSQMITKNAYGETYLSEDAEYHALIGLVAAVSGLTSYIVSMVDANISSKAINLQLGLANVKLGERANLSFNPDIRLVSDYSKTNSKSLSPSYGLNMRISF